MLVSSEISVVIRKQRNLLVHISTTTNCGSIIKIIGASTTDLILPGQILEDSPVQRVVSGQDIKYKIFLEKRKELKLLNQVKISIVGMLNFSLDLSMKT